MSRQREGWRVSSGNWTLGVWWYRRPESTFRSGETFQAVSGTGADSQAYFRPKRYYRLVWGVDLGPFEYLHIGRKLRSYARRERKLR